jgi:hypothetical protein
LEPRVLTTRKSSPVVGVKAESATDRSPPRLAFDPTRSWPKSVTATVPWIVVESAPPAPCV